MFVSAGGACAAIGNVGGVKSLVAAMKFFIKNVDVATACCDAIWSLSVSGKHENVAWLISVTCNYAKPQKCVISAELTNN